MRITAIGPRRKAMCAVYIDGEYALKLDEQTLLEHHIKVGDALSDEQLQQLLEQSQLRRAKEKALCLISYRDHSKKELTDKISRTCGGQAARDAADRMEELGLVNDENFARRYAQELVYKKHLAPAAAARKMYEKGIDRDLTQTILEEYTIPAKEQIELLLQGKYANKIADEKSRRRTVAALQRMGYCWSDIRCVLETYVPDEEYI